MDSFNCFDNAVYKMIHGFHMPLFMLISGFLYFFSFQKRDLKTPLISRTQSMVLSGYLPVVHQKLMEPFGYNVIVENRVVYNLIFTPLLAAVYAV